MGLSKSHYLACGNAVYYLASSTSALPTSRYATIGTPFGYAPVLNGRCGGLTIHSYASATAGYAHVACACAGLEFDLCTMNCGLFCTCYCGRVRTQAVYEGLRRQTTLDNMSIKVCACWCVGNCRCTKFIGTLNSSYATVYAQWCAGLAVCACMWAEYSIGGGLETAICRAFPTGVSAGSTCEVVCCATLADWC